jgi:hypothetical protein
MMLHRQQHAGAGILRLDNWSPCPQHLINKEPIHPDNLEMKSRLRRRVFVLAGFLCCLLASDLWAKRSKVASPPVGEGLGERLERIFDTTSPDIGELLPNVTCFDAGGDKFRLRSLKGQYTVLLFGCLT